MKHPDPAGALVEAMRAIQKGQWAQAERHAAQVLAAGPDEPDGLQFLGLVRENQGRLGEAEALLRRSLAARPGQAHVQVHLGRVLAKAGDLAGAAAMLQAAANAQPASHDAFLILAQVQTTTGELDAAERNYRTALRLNPGSQAALSDLAALLNRLRRPAEAEALLRTADDAARPAHARARLASQLGAALELQGRQEEAIGAWKRAIALDPLNMLAHHELNALLYRLERDGEFLSSYDEVLHALPKSRAAESGLLLLQMADFLIHARRFEEARECFARVAAIAPQSAGPQNGLAAAFAGLGQLDLSVAAYEQSMKLEPGDPATGVNLACVLLEAGDEKRALRLAEEAVARMPSDQAALAVYELALRANSDPRAEQLADYDRHIRVFDLDPPPGFSSMEDFNAALNAHLDFLHADRREPVHQTLRHGTQTAPSLLGDPSQLLRGLRLRLEEAVNTYIAQMQDDDAHPLAGRRQGGFAFAGSWSSRLKDCGFHTNHVHPKGWISSCYYVAVPDAVEDAVARQGWIKFGEPSFRTMLGQPVRRAIRPVPGRLVLFPSYMWHGTVPFHSSAARTTIAFDAIPAHR